MTVNVKRICIVINIKTYDKIIKIQGRHIVKTGKNTSFSQIVSDLLTEATKPKKRRKR